MNKDKEIFVRPSSSWKGVLARSARFYSGNGTGSDTAIASSSSYPSQSVGQKSGSSMQPDTNGADDPQSIINAHKSPMMQLWADERVREALRVRKVRLEEESGL